MMLIHNELASFLLAQVPYQFVHHSEGPYCDTQVTCSSVVRGIQNFHMDGNGWDDIGYRWIHHLTYCIIIQSDNLTF